VRRTLQDVNERLARPIALETTKFFSRQDHDCVAPMRRHMLWAVAFGEAHKLTETRLGVL
jgi:hypothetical protein